MTETVADGPSVAYVDGDARLKLDLRITRLSAVKKTAYRLAARCTTAFEKLDERDVVVLLTPVGRRDESAAREVVALFHRELLDQELREQLAEETAALRALIVANAFSRTNLVKQGE